MLVQQQGRGSDEARVAGDVHAHESAVGAARDAGGPADQRLGARRPGERDHDPFTGFLGQTTVGVHGLIVPQPATDADASRLVERQVQLEDVDTRTDTPREPPSGSRGAPMVT
jgi:hypothetical protein